MIFHPATYPCPICERPGLNVGRLHPQSGQSGAHLLAMDGDMMKRLHENYLGIRLVRALIQRHTTPEINGLAQELLPPLAGLLRDDQQLFEIVRLPLVERGATATAKTGDVAIRKHRVIDDREKAAEAKS